MDANKPSKFTPKQDRFCREYLVDMNATQAASRAGYSPRTANEQGARLLANASVKSRIAELQAEVAERLNITVDDVIAMLLEGFAKLTDYSPFSASLLEAKPLKSHIATISGLPRFCSESV